MDFASVNPAAVRVMETIMLKHGSMLAVSRTIAVGYLDRDRLPIASKYFIGHIRAHAAELA